MTQLNRDRRTPEDPLLPPEVTGLSLEAFQAENNSCSVTDPEPDEFHHPDPPPHWTEYQPD